jgi:hypothetical protein
VRYAHSMQSGTSASREKRLPPLARRVHES